MAKRSNTVATADSRTAEKGSFATADPPKLWCGKTVEVCGVTGEYNTGKTLFLLSLDPTHTLYYDFEKSGGDYAVDLGATRIDIPLAMGGKFTAGYRPIDTFEYWLSHVRRIERNRYSVIAVDTIGDLETGLADYVKQKLYAQCGFKTPDAFEAMGGVFWSEVKTFWKSTLSDIASRCQTFVFSSHLKTKYKGKIATSEKTPAGKSTLMELSSLYLWLRRDGTKAPSAEILKQRLSVTRMVNGVLEAHDVLPPRLPVATYAAICEYIKNPVGLRELRPEEQADTRELSEDQRLQMQLEISENQRMAAEAEASRPVVVRRPLMPLGTGDAIAAAAEAVTVTNGIPMNLVKPTPHGQRSAAAAATTDEPKTEANAESETDDVPFAVEGDPEPGGWEPHEEQPPVPVASDAEKAIVAAEKAATKQAKVKGETWTPGSPSQQLAAPPNAMEVQMEPASDDQLNRVKHLLVELKLPREHYVAMLEQYGVKSAKELLAVHCETLIADLASLLQRSDLDNWAEATLAAHK